MKITKKEIKFIFMASFTLFVVNIIIDIFNAPDLKLIAGWFIGWFGYMIYKNKFEEKK